MQYKKIQKEWTFYLCSLSDFEWYNKYFKSIIDKTGTYSILAHNGILCGDASFFYGNYESENLGTIVMLKDKYRPQLDIARDGVRGLTLETAAELEIIKKRLLEQNFELRGSMADLMKRNYSYIVMEDYCNLLYERQDLVNQLIFDTSEGRLSHETLSKKLLKKGKVAYNSWPEMYDMNNWCINGYLYKYLCAAFLREKYSVQIEFKSYYPKIFIFEKKKELSENYKKLFPACFFLPEINNNDTILASGNRYCRYACNEYHRLSQFILKNVDELHRYVPGIFKEFLRTLAEDKEDELISNVNNLLENLRKFPEGKFKVSDDLFISKEDFV